MFANVWYILNSCIFKAILLRIYVEDVTGNGGSVTHGVKNYLST